MPNIITKKTFHALVAETEFLEPIDLDLVLITKAKAMKSGIVFISVSSDDFWRNDISAKIVDTWTFIDSSERDRIYKQLINLKYEKL